MQVSEQGEIDFAAAEVSSTKEVPVLENGSGDLVSLKNNVEAKRIPGFIVIKVSGRFTFANFEGILGKLDKILTPPVVEKELKVWESLIMQPRIVHAFYFIFLVCYT